MRAQLSLVLLPVVFLSACSLDEVSEPAAGGTPIQTDKAVYTAEPVGAGDREVYAFDLTATFENTTAQTVYLGRCFPDTPMPIYRLEVLGEADGQQAAYDAVWACVDHGEAFAIAPGATRVDTFRIAGPNAWPDGSDEGIGVLEGEFRLSYDARTCPEEVGCALPAGQARSNVFDVRLAP
ncbi:MAG: hypothetical protein AAGI08_14570 [Bacteroidota bacterium]